MVDSGAGASLIGGALAESLGLELEGSNLKRPDAFLRSASGEIMTVAGKATVRFHFENGEECAWSVYVVPSFAHGLLLGNDFFRYHGASMDFADEGSFRLASFAEGDSVPMIYASQNPNQRGVLAVRGDTTIPATSQAIFRIAIASGPAPKWLKPRMTVEVERRPEVVTEKGVLVARSWDVFDTQGQIVVRVANPYDYQVL